MNHCGVRMVCVEGGGFRSYACVRCDHTEMVPPIPDPPADTEESGDEES
ncbi:hypothetical protein [Streptomyces iconiensis]|uniref:Uncharacterized protein n=1 Tax=Streptomyces iconiensis TaxID=1384038 RepID=A0ABT6ZRT4_9ACTN|nr:hypothetical protein [Streptomyces iconiensis]MDJ1131777.1 hypothetical protein [Streptomyces iconiensis]